MQAIKDKLNDMSEIRKAKADAKSEEKAEKDLAKARVDVAHEVRLAREAEAEMDVHVARAAQKAEKEISKHSHDSHQTFHESSLSDLSPSGGAPATTPTKRTV